MTTANDILCSMFAARGLRMNADTPLPSADSAIEAHLQTAIIEGEAPTLVEFKAAIPAYEAMIAKSQQDALIAKYTARLEQHYDATAQMKRYDNHLTCALRSGYTGPFQAEGQAFAIWMDTCNALAYQIMDEVLAGTRPMPTEDELIGMFPEMVWPT